MKLLEGGERQPRRVPERVTDTRQGPALQVSNPAPPTIFSADWFVLVRSLGWSPPLCVLTEEARRVYGVRK